ncbi:hypothetical protein LTR37_020872 [Vermiconidia calcicola]|uniref:Uncharacterized protein n=1 Tax=Vermiconidia calcicola TaxID=1690605 RepID=A0ACC3MD36_9PEZI|nr:hypothetical protein LTR37_020872 [Vermiconidia calcicola]
MSSPGHREASFLGLPAELRLKIYEYLVHTDINCRILDNVLHTSGCRGTAARLILNPSATLSSSVPWLSLLMTCRDVASELNWFMNDAALLNDERNRTCATWRSLPCKPSQARNVVMNVKARSGSGPWTEGGAASLARALYQMLNHVAHNGPRLERHSQLKEHMRLQELILNIDIGEYTSPPALGCNTFPDFNYALFQGGWTQISKTGFLMGYVGKTLLRSEGKEQMEVATEWQKVPSVPGYWRGYGFQWGVNNGFLL